MNKKELIEEISERIEMLDVVMISINDVSEKEMLQGKMKALNMIKEEVNLLDINPYELAPILEKKFENRELGIKGSDVRNGFEAIMKEYIDKCKKNN